jgi:hypothetical protein
MAGHERRTACLNTFHVRQIELRFRHFNMTWICVYSWSNCSDNQVFEMDEQRIHLASKKGFPSLNASKDSAADVRISVWQVNFG